MKTIRPIEGPAHAPTLAYLLPPVGGDDAELYIGIRPHEQTAREIGRRDELIGSYFVSLIEAGTIAFYRHVDLDDEFSPETQEYDEVQVTEGHCSRSTEIVIRGFTSEKAAFHHVLEWSEYRRLTSPVGKEIARHQARFAYAAGHWIEVRPAYTKRLSDAMKPDQPDAD